MTTYNNLLEQFKTKMNYLFLKDQCELIYTSCIYQNVTVAQGKAIRSVYLLLIWHTNGGKNAM